MFNRTVQLTPLASSLCNSHSVRSRLKVTDRSLPTVLLYFGILYTTQLRQPSRTQSLVTTTKSSPLLALSSHPFRSKPKIFLFDQSFSPKSVCTYSCRFFGLFTLVYGFHSVIFTLSFILTSFSNVSVCG